MLLNYIKSTLSEQIADLLRIDIFKNKLQNGQELSEATLSEKFGVSRGPVRDALRSLEMEGLVYAPTNGRTFIVSFTAKNLVHFHNLREYFEAEAVREVLRQPDDKSFAHWLEDMQELLDRSNACLASGDTAAFTNTDFDFHYSLLERSGVRIYHNMWKVLNNMSRCIIEVNHTYMYSLALSNPQETVDFHGKILDGLKKRDEEYTLRQIHLHIKNTTKIYEKVLENFSTMNNDAAGQ